MTLRTPCSIAFFAASSAASCAANGVDLREPLNPHVPDARPRDDVARDVGDRDDRVVERRRDVRDAGLDVLPDLLLLLALDRASSMFSFRAHFFVTAPMLLHRHAARTLAGAGVGVRALTASRQVPAMAHAAVAAEIDRRLMLSCMSRRRSPSTR